MSKDNQGAIFIADFAGKCIWNKKTGKAYDYPVSKEQDGKELREGIDFLITWQDKDDRAIPIEPDTHLRTKDDLVKKGEAGYEWLNYIKQFPKLDELWNQLPNVPNVWLSQQIDIFAGKYPSKPDTPLQPVKESAMGWLKKEGYPDVMPMTLDNLEIILNRYVAQLKSTTKPLK